MGLSPLGMHFWVMEPLGLPPLDRMAPVGLDLWMAFRNGFLGLAGFTLLPNSSKMLPPFGMDSVGMDRSYAGLSRVSYP